MSKKALNIHKRKDGRWEGRYKVGIYSNGATKYASVYGQSCSEAKDKLVAAMTAQILPHSKTKERRFSEILQLWLCNNRLKQKGSTELKYRTIIEKHINPELGVLKLSQITAITINSFLDRKLKSGRIDKKGGLSPSYVRSMSLIIQAAMQFAVDEQFCQPLKSAVCKPTAEKKSLEILSKEEQRRLEIYLADRRDKVSLGVMISMYSGLRIGEVCALSWEDIDLQAKVIHVRHTVSRIRSTDPKSGRQTTLILDTPKTIASVRDIPISSVLLSRLLEVNKTSSIGYVLSDTLSFISPRTYEYRFHRLLNDCGINQVSYHTLRHTFATRCIEAGVDVKSLSEMLGHANVGITLNTYVHSSMDLKRRQLEKLHADA